MSDRGLISKRYGSLFSPVIPDHPTDDDEDTPETFRQFCDYCNEPQKRKPGGRKTYGRGVTYKNADKLVRLRYLAEMSLEFFNDEKSTSFELVKVLKINHPNLAYFGLNFTAKEHGMEECHVFRSVVYRMGGEKQVEFVEIKTDDVELTLRSDDRDYVVGSKRECESEIESEDSRPCKR